MEKKNNNGVLIGILIGIIIMVLIVIGLFATNTISFNTKKTSTNNQEKENIQETTKENKEINEEQNTNKVTNENTQSFKGEYVHNLSNGDKVYTDYTEDGAFYYKRIDSNNNVSTYGYGIYKIEGNILIQKIVFGIDIDKKSISKSMVPESKYKIGDNSIEYDASETSGQNYTEEKVSNESNIIKEVTTYLYSISKNNEYSSNFKYE